MICNSLVEGGGGGSEDQEGLNVRSYHSLLAPTMLILKHREIKTREPMLVNS